MLGDWDADRLKFVVTHGAKFNFGPSTPSGVHAPSAAPDGKGGIIVIFNMNPGRPSEGWNQIMTLPRRLTLLGEDELAIEPAGDVASLRREHRHVGPTPLPANQELVLDGIGGSAVEIEAELDPRQAPMVELNVLRSQGKKEYTRIAFYRDRGFRHLHVEGRRHSLITIDASYASLAPDALSRAPETAPIYLQPDEPLKLRLFIDRSVVELFANGKQCLAMRVYPTRADSTGVSLRAQGQDAVLRSLDAWRMESIWPE